MVDTNNPVLIKVFGYTKPCLDKKATTNACTVENLAGTDDHEREKNLANVRDNMRTTKNKNDSINGLIIDGDERLLGLGAFAVVAKTAIQKFENGPIKEVEGAVTRLEHSGTARHPIVLRPAFSQEYPEATITDEHYRTDIVPFAPNLPDKPVTNEDALRTIQVLKADHLDHALWDVQANKTDALAFLKDPHDPKHEKYICYPDTNDVPDFFRGKPIAFVRDLNAINESWSKPPENQPSTPIQRFLEKAFPDLNYDELKPAPRECVEACKQQYEVTAKLAAALTAAGITPNVEIPSRSHSNGAALGSHAQKVKLAPEPCRGI